jgi:acyl-CoA synthetase (AMP-forming)/AMP-acid ligase II
VSTAPCAATPALPTVAHLLELRAHERPQNIAYTHLSSDASPPVRISYAELHHRASRIAANLNERGLRGCPVLLLYHAGPDFAPAFFGSLMAGAIATPVPAPRFESQYRRLDGVVRDCTPGALLSTTATLEWLYERLPASSPLRACPWLATDGQMDGPRVEHLPQPSDIAVLQYTSGSTSDPRGVAVSHANLAHNLATITSEFQPSGNARLLSWLPHFHDMGLIGGVLSPMTWGGEAILMSPQQFLRRPLRWLEAISEYGVEVSGAPNFAYEMCVNWAKRGGPNALSTALDLSSWRIAFVGAEPIRATTLAGFTESFKTFGFQRSALLPCYGMAEATLLVSCKPAHTVPSIYSVSRDGLEQGRATLSGERDPIRLVGCGYPVAGTDVRIVDPASGEPLGHNCVGELWVSGPQVARGYWNDRDNPSFCAKLEGCPGQAFLRTGDLGFLTEGGEFVFVERLKDLIVLNGQNYVCRDLDQTVIASHSLLCADGCAVGLIEKDQAPHMVVIAEFPVHHLDRAEETANAIRGALFTVHGLSARTVAFIPPGKLSRTTSGKLQRRETLKRLASGSLRLVAHSGEPIPGFSHPPGGSHIRSGKLEL